MAANDAAGSRGKERVLRKRGLEKWKKKREGTNGTTVNRVDFPRLTFKNIKRECFKLFSSKFNQTFFGGKLREIVHVGFGKLVVQRSTCLTSFLLSFKAYNYTTSDETEIFIILRNKLFSL